MKILVLNPPAFKNQDYIREGRCMQTKSSWAALWMPLSLCYISAVLRKDGHQIRLIDAIAEKLNNKKLAEISASFNPGLIILNTALPSIEGDMNCASILKKTLPSVKIVIVGMFPTIYESECLTRFSQIDYAVMDEPEWVTARLTDVVAGNSSPCSVKGLIYRNGNDVIVNERQNLAENNPDDLPFPTRDLLNNNAYRLPTNGKKFTLLSVGRGCSANCIFCIANIYYGKKFRKRSVENIMQEIEQCINEFNITNFLFWGESFTTDRKYGEEICDEIIKMGFKISWSTTSRVDTLNQTLLDKMKRAGCILLGLGIESYEQDVLNLARKGITTDQIDKAILMTRKAGLNTMGHFMFGLPGDTNESALKSIRFACKNLTYAQFYAAIPYPKTELGKIAGENNWIEESDYSRFELTQSVMGNGSLSAKEIKKLRDYAYRKFYFRPKMFLQTIREVTSFVSFLSVLNFMNWIKPKNT
jgi:anaerobic magnesium-protoporphyrin IX monomethyl ester cyclase